MKQLDIIANTITANLANTDSRGLVNGKMGLCLFLFEYAKASGYKHSQEMAEMLLSEQFISILEPLPTDIKDGYAGIGIGLCMLLEKKFAKGSPQKVLRQLDKLILEDIEKFTFNDLRYNSAFFSAGIYLLHRLPLADEEQRRTWCRQLVDALKSVDEKVAKSENSFNYSYFSESVVAVLETLRAYKMVEEEEINRLVETFTCRDVKRFYSDDLDHLAERLWFAYLHKQQSSITEKVVEDFIADRISVYPYILDKINSDLAILGLQLLKNKIFNLKQNNYERTK